VWVVKGSQEGLRKGGERVDEMREYGVVVGREGKKNTLKTAKGAFKEIGKTSRKGNLFRETQKRV
jgi:hypothetical protein